MHDGHPSAHAPHPAGHACFAGDCGPGVGRDLGYGVEVRRHVHAQRSARAGRVVVRQGREGGATRSVWWQRPSVGFDIGGNAAKCFTLVYNLRDTERLFQRFPGVEGNLYFVGGFGLNYNRTDEITLAPVRLGVGWRQGANIGYLHFTPKRELLPI